ncbi:uncharacterized protein LOC117649554 [Thrips palmi]|uniref:Uncharacterized protein LOC117649554 n=1 Tax=Thrips palmi TaxID=161013 RepID=A0A6P8ZTJ1_THRPL|nr:uncharacterized protein LOC117649554 [Thrips palmi]
MGVLDMLRGRGVPNGDEGPLRSVMGAWQREISSGTPGIGRLLLRTMQGSRISMIISLGYQIFLLSNIAFSGSLENAKTPFRLFSGAYSTQAAQFIFFLHRHHAEEALRITRCVAEDLEKTADEETKVRLRRAARLIRIIKIFFLIHMLNATFSVCMTPLSMGFDSWLIAAKVVFMCIGMVVCCWAYYTLLPLMLCVHLACCALYREVGQRLQAHIGLAEVSRCARLHSSLKEAERHMDSLVGMYFPHYLLVAILLPLLSIAEVLTSDVQADMYALSTVPIVFIIIVPQCLVGQYLEDCSGAVPQSCYFGPWLEEDRESRRGRLLVMKLGARPDFVRVQGMGRLNRAACASILRSWCGYLQVVVRFSNNSQ